MKTGFIVSASEKFWLYQSMNRGEVHEGRRGEEAGYGADQ